MGVLPAPWVLLHIFSGEFEQVNNTFSVFPVGYRLKNRKSGLMCQIVGHSFVK